MRGGYSCCGGLMLFLFTEASRSSWARALVGCDFAEAGWLVSSEKDFRFLQPLLFSFSTPTNILWIPIRVSEERAVTLRSSDLIRVLFAKITDDLLLCAYHQLVLRLTWLSLFLKASMAVFLVSMDSLIVNFVFLVNFVFPRRKPPGMRLALALKFLNSSHFIFARDSCSSK